MKPITKVPEEEFAKMIEEKVAPLGEKLEEISIKLIKDKERPKEEKIEDIIRKIKQRNPEKIFKEKEKIKDENQKEEPKDVSDEADCPTCKVGHVHKMTGNARLKCNGDKCGEEFVMIPTHADYTCDNCGLPIKKPEEGKKIESCPSCGNKKASSIENGIPSLKFDFTKMKK